MKPTWMLVVLAAAGSLIATTPLARAADPLIPVKVGRRRARIA